MDYVLTLIINLSTILGITKTKYVYCSVVEGQLATKYYIKYNSGSYLPIRRINLREDCCCLQQLLQ